MIYERNLLNWMVHLIIFVTCVYAICYCISFTSLWAFSSLDSCDAGGNVQVWRLTESLEWLDRDFFTCHTSNYFCSLFWKLRFVFKEVVLLRFCKQMYSFFIYIYGVFKIKWNNKWIDVLYHPGKSNVVADALSRKYTSSPFVIQKSILLNLQILEFEIVSKGKKYSFSALVLKPALHDRIEEGQKENMYLCRLKRMIDARKRPNFYVTDDGIIRYKGCNAQLSST